MEVINEEAGQKFYLISWKRPLGEGYMGCIVDSNGRLVDTINNLFYKGGPSNEFNKKCGSYNIKGKMSDDGKDHYMLSGTYTSIKEAILKFKEEFFRKN